MANGRPKPAFFLAMFLVVAGLIYYGVSRFGGTKAGPGGGDAITPQDLANQKGGAEAPRRGERRARGPDGGQALMA